MADRVIIAQVRRGGNRLSLVELRQYLGRSGRRHGTDGRVDIFLGEEDEGLEDEIRGGTEPIVSSLVNYEMHLLPLIKFGIVKSVVDCEAWWAKTFAGVNKSAPNFEKIVEKMNVDGLISGFNVTDLGMISVDYVFEPSDIIAWKNNFEKLFELKKEDNDAYLSYAFGNVKNYKYAANFRGHEEVFELYNTEIEELDVEDVPTMNCVLWWVMLGNHACGQDVGLVVRDMRRDIGRVMGAIKKLNSIYSWGRGSYLSKCDEWLKRGIPSKMRHLFTSSSEMNNGRALALIEAGVNTEDDYESWGKDLEFDE